jgi:acyl carrier protein
MRNIKAEVRAFIKDNFFMGDDSAMFQDGDSFIENHIVDSTGFLELISYLEDSFAFKVEDKDMVPENLDSLNNIETYIRTKLT